MSLLYDGLLSARDESTIKDWLRAGRSATWDALMEVLTMDDLHALQGRLP